ncbi:alpha/beta fold hydrolase [Paenibacillus sp. Marseille-Q4541]|uniref:alpha/beta fold hydrolase n=1 Tax=Paenibacillus sp. Marseille-Q4541 TaxID=2831522 RepID=UPI001BA5FA20
MYEQYVKHCWCYKYPVSFMKPTLQMYAPYSVSPAYTGPVNTPMYAPSAISPVYAARENAPMYTPSAKKEIDTQLPLSTTSQKRLRVMDFFFKDKSFNFETLRAAGFAVDNGADLNEVFLTAAAIPEGDEEAWMREWKASADRIYQRGKYSIEYGDKISAREAFLRASAYYRSAEFYRRKDPLNDPHVLELFGLSREAFVKAGKLLDGPFEEISIPYGKDKLPGYLLLVDDSGKPRPTLIYTNGFDSTTEEGYYVIGASALRRGFNVILYDGPGTGRMIREKKVPFRPDWEAVLGPVMDYAETRPEVDMSKIVLFGYSMGGYLCARTAAFDHRPAAIVLDDGMTSFFATYPPLPEFLVEWIKAGYDEQAIPVLEWIKKHDTYARWALQNGVWVFGTSNEPEYIRKSEQFSLTTEDMHKIKSRTLILEGENDLVFKGQASKLASELKAPHKHVVMRNADGAGEHCHMGAMRLLHQTIFDWLHTNL